MVNTRSGYEGSLKLNGDIAKFIYEVLVKNKLITKIYLPVFNNNGGWEYHRYTKVSFGSLLNAQGYPVSKK